MEFARASEEWTWQDEFSPYMQSELSEDNMHNAQSEAETLRVCEDIDSLYFFRFWEGLERYISFERRIQHRGRAVESLFAGWHNVKIFSRRRGNVGCFCMSCSRVGTPTRD